MSTKRFILLVLLIGGGGFLAGIFVTHYDRFPYPQLVALRSGLRTATGGGPDLEQGEQIFRSQCAVCHGPEAKGGRGPDLTRGTLTPDAIITAVTQGIPGTEMPGSWTPAAQSNALVAYVMSLQVSGSTDEDIAAAAAAGREVFTSQDCATCHVVEGKASGLGPSLADIGSRRSADHLRSSIVEPNRYITTGFQPVSVTRPDGSVQSGFLIDKDPFSVRIRDNDGRLLAFSTRDATVQVLNTSPMTSYGSVLDEQQLSDLVTYLSTLQ
jgi:putative heme-binding domain-containing protein